ncbi:MAG: HD domain-containing protein [Hahellaceae bacterium]|jgi:HD-GYP domain-containing protein (c-di-GMP phosphodiesterase class II)|nr:HD domain-containing protein [Hahellaceae bacterium]MCP5212012.1 HD domain-containing protein [Hahellaceae bacterium]
MALPVPQNVDPGLLDDFILEFEEAYVFCENKLVELEKSPGDQDMINQLFRSVHTVKGNLTFIAFESAIPLLQSVEDVLTGIRSNDFPFTSSISDVVLLSLDKTKAMIDELGGHGDSGLTVEIIAHISQLISRIASASERERDAFIQAAIIELDPTTMVHRLAKPEEAVAEPPESEFTDSRILKALTNYNVTIDEDLLFFIKLMHPLEHRSSYWAGRSLRLLMLALGMNRAAGNSVDARQLAAAVLMHDISMAFLPTEILHKKGPLTQDERMIIQQHAHSSNELLLRMQQWDLAARMVQEHHERSDGEGYPAGLKEDEICDGAKILSIIDAYDAITHERAHTTKVKRPFIRAVLEINSQSGAQFSPKWIEIFNVIVKKLHQLKLV